MVWASYLWVWYAGPYFSESFSFFLTSPLSFDGNDTKSSAPGDVIASKDVAAGGVDLSPHTLFMQIFANFKGGNAVLEVSGAFMSLPE